MWEVGANIPTWGCLRSDALFPQPCFFFFAVLTENILPVPLIEHWSVIEVERWKSSWTSRVLWGRQQHLHTAEAGDWRSIISFYCAFKQVRPCQPENTEPGLDKHVVGFNFSSAPLIIAAEKQWLAESTQRNNERKANLLFQIYLSCSTVATLWSDWCPLF